MNHGASETRMGAIRLPLAEETGTMDAVGRAKRFDRLGIQRDETVREY